MSVEERIEAKLQAAFTLEFLEIENQSHLHAGHAGSPNSGESHFQISLKSPELDSLSRLERYRKVHSVLKEELDGPVHALSLRFGP